MFVQEDKPKRSTASVALCSQKKCKNVLAQHGRTQTHWPGECPAGETLPGLCSREQARSRQIWFFSTQVLFCFLLEFFVSLVTEAVRAAFHQLFGQYFIFSVTLKYLMFISPWVSVSP